MFKPIINVGTIFDLLTLEGVRLSQDQGWIFYLGLVMALQLNEIKS